MSNEKSRISFDFGSYKTQVDDRLTDWTQQHFLRRLWDKDHTLWSSEPLPELTDRLGWLGLPEKMMAQLDDILQFRDEIRTEGISRVVLLGMGGSSLAPEVFARSFGSAPEYPELIVMDSTHPDAVTAVREQLELDRTFFLVSSKSGTTLETLSLFRFFWEEKRKSEGEPGRHFAAITDPKSPLSDLANERKFRTIFDALPDVGGRFSVFSVFGLVPAALIGVDIHSLLKRAMQAVEDCAPGVLPNDSTAVILGAMLGELAGERNKVTFLTSPSLQSFADWMEQLMAESSGKEGKGILPVVHEPRIQVADYGADRLFVGFFLDGETDNALEAFCRNIEASDHPAVWINLEDRYDLGREFFRWEIAIAAACSVMGINPFNQPDVQLSKDLTRRVMKGSSVAETLEGSDLASPKTISTTQQDRLAQELNEWIRQSKPGDYIAIQAYVVPAPDVVIALQEIKRNLLNQTCLATTLGYGPRYLHSTGQLHKGGPNSGLFLQLVAESRSHVTVPETNYSFDSIIRAQGIGDYSALTERHRRVLRVDLGQNILESLDMLSKMISL